MSTFVIITMVNCRQQMTAKQTKEVNKLPVCYMSAFCETDGLWTSLSMCVPLH